MRDRLRISRWLVALLCACATSAFGTTYQVAIGDHCDYGAIDGAVFYGPVCFSPAVLTINVGDSVHFFQDAEYPYIGLHNVVADDGSFRCARACDEGADGTPARYGSPSGLMDFTREFDVPGIVKYHDEVTGAPGVIHVGVHLPAAIGTSFTGTWFNASQSGMGFMVEILPGSPIQMLAAWLTFAPDGSQTWIVGVGPVAGHEAMLQATQVVGSGARFPPNFDPANVHSQSWGVLTFSFSDCDHGHVDWSSSIAGYASGGMDLTRLTLPAGLTCPAVPTVQAASHSKSP